MSIPLSWFRVWVGAGRHRKVRRLAKLLNVSRVTAFGYAGLLWDLTASNSPNTGVLEKALDLDDIEKELDWEGARGELIRALVKAELLDAGPLQVHNWPEHQPGIVRAERLAEARRRDPLPAEVSAYFKTYWELLPSGAWKSSRPRTYRIWIDLGLDAPGADEVRSEVYRALRSQRDNEAWLARNKNANSRSYLRNRMWEGWFRDTSADHRTTAVPIIDPPQRSDDKDLRADWQAIPGNEQREYPGPERAMSEVIAHAGKQRN
jgi:hypothetical protein